MTLSLPLIEQYDSIRPLDSMPFRSLCYAPHNSMFFDPRGHVRACCVNHRFILGDLTRQRLDDIWFGKRSNRLRAAMDRYDLALGCEYCEWQIKDGNFYKEGRAASPVHALKYDLFPVQVGDPAYPTNLEFNLHNTCNLECVTCNGNFSSSILTHREKAPPMPRAYGDVFFEDLRKYIPHVKTAQFLGGEPFLIVEHFRVWEMMIEDATLDWCGVTTNGTIYNAKVERILEKLPIRVCLSMDGVRKSTFEAIRVNARFETFMENFDRFDAYSKANDWPLNINFTISRLNWRELPDMLLFAEEKGAMVSVCQVVDRPELNVLTLPQPELVEALSILQARDEEMRRTLDRNLPNWRNYLENIEHRLRHLDRTANPFERGLEESSAAPASDWEAEAPEHRAFRDTPDPGPEKRERIHHAARQRLTSWTESSIEEIAVNDDDVVVSIVTDHDSLLDLGADFVGQKTDAIFAALMGVCGGDVKATDLEVTGDLIDRIISFGGTSPSRTYLRVITLPRFVEPGRVDGVVRLVGRRVGAPGPIELPLGLG